MNLDQLRKRLSKDASFRNQHKRVDQDAIDLALHIASVREEWGMTQKELADEVGISVRILSDFENFEPLSSTAARAAIKAVADKFEVRLRERGFDLDRWLGGERETLRAALPKAQRTLGASARRPHPARENIRKGPGAAKA